MDEVPELGDALPLVASDPRWLPIALADLDAVHADHLHCERKAAQSALSLIRSYPERADLVTAMARLAHDETRHVVQVAQLMARRGQPASYDLGDDYAAALREHDPRREPERLLDRLLVFAMIEGAVGRAARRCSPARSTMPKAARALRAPRRPPRSATATSSCRSRATPPRRLAGPRRRARRARGARSSRSAPISARIH